MGAARLSGAPPSMRSRKVAADAELGPLARKERAGEGGHEHLF